MKVANAIVLVVLIVASALTMGTPIPYDEIIPVVATIIYLYLQTKQEGKTSKEFLESEIEFGEG